MNEREGGRERERERKNHVKLKVTVCMRVVRDLIIFCCVKFLERLNNLSDTSLA